MHSHDTPRAPQRPPVSRTCEVCGSSFVRRPSQIEKSGGRFCSVLCHDVAQRDAAPVEVRLWQRVDKHGPTPPHRSEYSECWLWTGHCNRQGYGRLYRHFPDRVLTHRLAWEIATGETLTTDDVIGHICDVRHCIRNDDVGTYEVNNVVLPRRGHLFKGTPIDNAKDMVEKGRHRPYVLPVLRGSAAPWSKLTEDQVRAIRQRYAVGGITQITLGLEYGIHNVTVSEIILRKKWKHVN